MYLLEGILFFETAVLPPLHVVLIAVLPAECPAPLLHLFPPGLGLQQFSILFLLPPLLLVNVSDLLMPVQLIETVSLLTKQSFVLLLLELPSVDILLVAVFKHVLYLELFLPLVGRQQLH